MREDWIEIKLSEVSEQIKPGYPSGKHNTVGNGALHFRPYNISITGSVDTNQKKYVPIKSEEYFLENGDIVFNNTNSPELLGKTCYIANPDKWVFSNHMTRIRVRRIVNPKFCSLYLHYLYYKGFYRIHCSNHVNQASISSTFLKNYLNIPLPPLPEQRAIVAKIEQLLSELDNGIANLKAAREKLKIYRQAVLKKAFEGELTRGWRERLAMEGKRLPDAQDLLEQVKAERQAYYQQQLREWQQSVIAWDALGRKGKKPGKPKQTNEWSIIAESELTNLSEIPSQWLFIKMKDIAVKITDGEHITPKRTDNGFYLLSARNIQNGYIDYSNVDYVGKEEFERIRKRCDPEYGDILISCSGSVGRIAHVPKNSEFVMVRSVALVKTNSNIYNFKFLEYLLLSPVLQSQIEKGKKATAQANLFLGPIGNLNVIACSLEEQHQIVQEIETRLSVCDKLGASIEESLEKAEALRQSILKKAFEGKLLSEAELAACRQEADWEPAGQLLERIKGKKGAVQGKLFEV